MSKIQQFVTNQNIPEFIRADHSLYEAFVDAYYEWLEVQNDSEFDSIRELYKNVGNPAWIVSNQEALVDIDASIDAFMDYFAADVVPISLEGIQTDPKFFIKKIRDLYLAKGTAKSFKLFFKLYYNEDIDVFETRDTILRASDGKWFAFPTAHMRVEDFDDQVPGFDYDFATLEDSTGDVVGYILAGSTVDETREKESILKIQFSYDVSLKKNTSYFIVQSDRAKKIKVIPMVSLSSFQLNDGGCLYNENDPIYIESVEQQKTFLAAVTSVSKGYVEGIKVRDKGLYYSTSDLFEFYTDGKVGTKFAPTQVDITGAILKINGIPLRTGPQNTGFLANNLEDVFIPINGSTFWDELPDIRYRPGSSSFDNIGLPYVKTTDHGYGFQSIPVSTSIGVARGVELSQETYFKDSDDVFINAPATVIVENANLKKGQKVAFQTFDESASYGPFFDDSEKLVFKFIFERQFIHRDTTGVDSEVERNDYITVPYGFDSELFSWNISNVELNTRKKGSTIWDELIDKFDSESNLSYTTSYSSQIGLSYDGGSSFGATPVDSDLFASSDYEDSEIDGIVDGGDYFSFSRTDVESVEFHIEGAFLSKLEKYHFDLLDNIQGLDSENRNSFRWEVFKEDTRIISPFESLDSGAWKDLWYGEVVSIDHNNKVAKIISYKNSELPTQEEIDEAGKEKYHVVILSPLDNDDKSTKDHSLPLNNVVHQISRMDISFKTEVVSDLLKRFWSQDGFISSSYGGTIPDNYYYSDWSYRIRTQLPFADWKQKFKTLLHPAGTVLTSEYIQNITTKGLDFTADHEVLDDFYPRLTFDMQQEFIDLNPEGIVDGADSIFYKANAFESLNAAGTFAVSLDTSKQSTVPNLAYKQQSGNAYWDCEPIGWGGNTINTLPTVVGTYLNLNTNELFKAKLSTQDSDGNGNVLNTYNYLPMHGNTRQDMYKNNSRLGLKPPLISKVQFEDSAFNFYPAYDSDLPEDFLNSFVDSDKLLRAIDYSRLKSDSEYRYFPIFKTPRIAEIAIMKEKDLQLAMKENQSLVFVDSDVTYYDYEAYEQKWNTINTQRTRNNEGFVVKGSMNYVGYEHVVQRSKKRSKAYVIGTNMKYSPVNTPLSSTVWNTDTLVWNKAYYDQINTKYVESQYEQETYRDPQISMRNFRRGRKN